MNNNHGRTTTFPAFFPENVRGFDWTLPPWSGPPAERTRVGYWWWCYTLCDTEDPDYGLTEGREYFVLPDGSAEVREVSFDDDRIVRYAAGEWDIEYPAATFGSRGGVRIIPRLLN